MSEAGESSWLNPTKERERTVADFKAVIARRVDLGDAAVFVAELPGAETWQSVVVLMGQIGMEGVGPFHMYRGQGVGLLAYTTFSFGHRFASLKIDGEKEPDRYLLASPNPAEVLAGVTPETAVRDRLISNILLQATFDPEKAEIAARRFNVEPPLQRDPPWPRPDDGPA